MNNVKKITGWQTSDGKLFQQRHEAASHEAEIALGELIQREVGYAHDQEVVRGFLHNCKHQIYTLLDAMLVENSEDSIDDQTNNHN